VQYSKTYIANYSRFLVTLAWTVEIIAVLIGFTISIVVSISAYHSFSTSGEVSLLDGTSSVLVAGLPFLLIAVVELCKIPLTFAFMAVRHTAWRSLFLFFVIFLCLITFETMLNGFERNFSNLNRAIDSRRNDIESGNAEIELLEKRRAYIVKFTEEELMEEVEVSREVIETEFKTVAQRIDSNTAEVLSNIDYAFKEELEAEISRLMDIRDEYYTDWGTEKASVEERFSVLLLGNIKGSSDERERLLSELKALQREFNAAMDDANFFTRNGVETKYRQLIATKEDQLGKITLGYLGGEALEKQSTMEAQLKQQLEFVNSKYAGRVDDANQRIENLKQEIETRISNNAELETSVVSRASGDKARFARIRNEQASELDAYLGMKQEELEVIANRSFGIDEQIFQLRNQQRVLQSEINHLINQNQIYRLAMYAGGKQSATEVERGMVGIVALLWFGSLALISSVCGVMLALAGFYLRRITEATTPEDSETSANRV
jgi:F0F1-type ATP synthase membrane subunit b/b'